MKYLIDSYAWIEYFRGSPEGKKAAKYIDSDHDLFTPAIVIAELSDKYRKSNLVDIWENERIVFIGIKSEIVSIDQYIADLAGKIKIEKRKEFEDFGLADAIVLSTVIKYNAKLLTGDRHLVSDKNAINIRE